jgi:hypothetical protein
MLAQAGDTLPTSLVPDATPAAADSAERGRWTMDVRSIAMIFATNTTLFCALDVAQWLADLYALSTLPTNLLAAVIATTLGLAFAAAPLMSAALRNACLFRSG